MIQLSKAAVSLKCLTELHHACYSKQKTKWLQSERTRLAPTVWWRNSQSWDGARQWGTCKRDETVTLECERLQKTSQVREEMVEVCENAIALDVLKASHRITCDDRRQSGNCVKWILHSNIYFKCQKNGKFNLDKNENEMAVNGGKGTMTSSRTKLLMPAR